MKQLEGITVEKLEYLLLDQNQTHDQTLTQHTAHTHAHIILLRSGSQDFPQLTSFWNDH